MFDESPAAVDRGSTDAVEKSSDAAAEQDSDDGTGPTDATESPDR
ncbi:hypothetical protein [Halorubrum sp. BV1]|nr:hypothetical protein [Halorubrum sp. BV1]